MAAYVVEKARPGDVDDAIRVIDDFGWHRSLLINVGDKKGPILEDALRAAFASDLCLISGGLGPTHDDRTIELVARVAGRALHVDRDLERQIEAVSRSIAERLGRPYEDFATGVRKQATLPEGALSLGLAGTALGNVFLWANDVVYDRYASAPRAWGLSPLADQELGGAIMLAEGAVVTIAVFAWLVLSSIAEAEPAV